MIKNYLKIALKILWRKKFFTFISLFGISFTLMILTLMVAFLDNELGTNAPMKNGDRIVYIDQVQLKKEEVENIYNLDTNYIDGVMVIDTANQTTNRSSSTSNSSPSYYLLNTYYKSPPFAKNYTFFSGLNELDLYINNKKLPLKVCYTDERYWEIFNFEFVEGGFYHEDAVIDAQPVIVISEETQNSYFGNGISSLGKEIVIKRKHYKVIGVTRKTTSSNTATRADIFFPLSHAPQNVFTNKDFHGGFTGVFMAKSPSQIPQLKESLQGINRNIELPNPEDYDQMSIDIRDHIELYAKNLIGGNDPKTDVHLMYIIIGGIMTLFVLLPTINLINVNITRIMERSSEIGIRKAFGAQTTDLVFQFIFENVVLSAIGGIFGLIFSTLLINIINNSEFLPNTVLTINFSVLIYATLITLIFGIVSGLSPSIKMARVSIIKALKNS